MTRHRKGSHSHEKCNQKNNKKCHKQQCNKKSHFDFGYLSVKKVKALKGKFCKVVADKLVAREDIILQGQHIDERFELNSTTIRTKFDEYIPPLFSQNGENNEENIEEVRLIKEVINDDEFPLKEIVSNIKFIDVENVTSYTVNVVVFYEVLDLSGNPKIFLYNVENNQFEESGTGPIQSKYVLYNEITNNTPTPTETINITLTIQFTNLEMQTFLNQQSILVKQLAASGPFDKTITEIVVPPSVLFIIDLNETSPIKSLETKSCTPTYGNPGNFIFSMSNFVDDDLFLVAETCTTNGALLVNPTDHACLANQWIYNVGTKTIQNRGTGKYITGSRDSFACARKIVTLGTNIGDGLKFDIETGLNGIGVGGIVFVIPGTNNGLIADGGIDTRGVSIGIVEPGASLWKLFSPLDDCIGPQ